jgi:hypothetical protein
VRWLIDDAGKTWPDDPHPIARSQPLEQPLAYTVFERGFVYVQNSASSTAIWFNPRRTRRRTLATTLYLISTCRAPRFALTYGSTTKQKTEIFGEVGPVPHRIQELCASAPPERAAILSQVRREVRRLGDKYGREADGLIEAWCETGRVWGEGLYANLCASRLLRTTSIARNPAGSARFVIQHWGTGLEFVSDQWAKIAVGKEVREQPFRELGRNVARLYRQTVREDRPSRYDVSIVVPATDGTPFQYDYERLLLPWHHGRDRYVVHALVGVSRRPVLKR